MNDYMYMREIFNFLNLEKKNQEVLKFQIEIFWNLEDSLKSELLKFLNTLDYGTLINKEIEPISISTFFVEIHLDIVLEVLLMMVGLIFVSTKLVDRYHISDMIPVALPPSVAGAGLTRSLFILCIVQYVVYLT